MLFFKKKISSVFFVNNFGSKPINNFSFLRISLGILLGIVIILKNRCKFIPLEKNLIDGIWKRKIKRSGKKFYNIPAHAVGLNSNLKIKKVSSYIKKKGADFQLITASENCAWLLNIRGKDTKYTPIPNSYILIDKNKNLKFFCDLKKTSYAFKKKFKKIEFVDIKQVEKFLSKINRKKFIIDKNSCSFLFENIILKNNKILDYSDPIYLLKSVKSKNSPVNIMTIE